MSTTFPWWIIPLFVLAVPLAILYMRTVYGERRWWLYVVVSLAILNMLTFLLWGFLPYPLPWFLIPWVLSGLIVAFLWFKYRNSGTYDSLPDEAVPPPQAQEYHDIDDDHDDTKTL